MSTSMQTLPGGSQFPTTRWTLVIAVGDPQRKEARSALASLRELLVSLVCLSAPARLCGRPGAGDRERAQKRGGGAVAPLEFSSGEDRYLHEPAHDETQ